MPGLCLRQPTDAGVVPEPRLHHVLVPEGVLPVRQAGEDAGDVTGRDGGGRGRAGGCPVAGSVLYADALIATVDRGGPDAHTRGGDIYSLSPVGGAPPVVIPVI